MSHAAVTAPAAAPVTAPPTAPESLPELLRLFNEVSGRLQDTHRKLEARVAHLQAELADAHERLQRSRSLAALGEMAAGIAHEVRNPLASISLHAEMLAEDLADRPAQQEVVEKIGRAVSRLDAIVGDVLRFARDTRVQAVRCRASEVVAHAISVCEAEVAAGGVSIDSRVGEDVVITADPGPLAQALANVIRNGVEAMVEHGSKRRAIEIEAGREHRLDANGRRRLATVLIVQDSGPGVPAEALGRVFNPFFTTRAAGTGLGLAIVHRIVDGHGGSVSISNARAGARVEIVLPDPGMAPNGAAGVSLNEAVEERLRSMRGVVERHGGGSVVTARA